MTGAIKIQVIDVYKKSFTTQDTKEVKDFAKLIGLDEDEFQDQDKIKAFSMTVECYNKYFPDQLSKDKIKGKEVTLQGKWLNDFTTKVPQFRISDIIIDTK